MRAFIAGIFTLIALNLNGQTLGEVIKNQTDSLQNSGIDSLIIHRYSLFNGRLEIPYNDDELQCDNEPTVAHIIWAKNNNWYCRRLDNCGLFKVISIGAFKFGKIKIDQELKFKKHSPHFTQYKLVKIENKSEVSTVLSGYQLNKENHKTTKSIQTINRLIEGLEDKKEFKREI